jgi:hypothetical protein
MPVEVGCAQCGKKYRVDDKLVGKKIRCKNCQNVMRVEGEAAGVAVEAKGSAKASVKAPVKTSQAPVVKKRVSSGGGVQQRSAPQPEAPDLPDLSGLDGLDVPSGPTLELDEPEVRSAAAGRSEAGCPGCGAPFPAANRVCMNCGFNRASGQRAKTQVALASREEAPGHMSRVGHDGTRLWTPYQNGFLNFTDTWGPRAAVFVFVAYSLVMSVVVPLVRGGAGQEFFLRLAAQLIFFGILYVIVLPITVYGVRLGGGIFKFELPEDGRSRVLAAHVLAAIIAGVILAVAVIAATATVGATPHSGVHVTTGVLAMLGGTIITAVLAYLCVSFLLFKLFFHLKFVEALLGYLLMVVFYLLGIVVAVAMMAGVVLVFGLLIAAVMRAH